MIERDDEIFSEEDCPKCGSEIRTSACDNCEDGASYHDCGDDTCCCLNPMANVRCSDCGGHGIYHWCPTCGWDLNFNQYINGVDERERHT